MAGCRENSISTQFIFTVTTPDGSFQAKPMNNKLRWKFTFEEGFPWVELETELIFADSVSNDSEDFTKLYPYERQKERCEKIHIDIQRVYKGNAAPFFSGFFRVADCKWNVSDSRCSTKVQTQNPYTCIIENWEDRFNIIEYANPEDLKAYVGERKEIQCINTFYSDRRRLSPREPYYNERMIATDCDIVEFSTYLKTEVVTTELTKDGEIVEEDRYGHRGNITPTARDPEDTGLPTGSVSPPKFSNTRIDSNGNFYPFRYTIISYYAYDFVDESTQPPGNGWVSYDGGWARPSITHTYENEDGERITEPMFKDDIQGAYSFNTVLENVLNDYCGANVVSNFYGINPDGSNPENKYYSRAAEEQEMKELFIVPKSEIINYGRSNRTTNIFDKTEEEGYTFKEFLNDLRKLHSIELRWLNGKFYLEHESYFKKEYRLDITQDKYSFNLKGAWKYKYSNVNMPSEEKWQFMDVTDKNGDFDSSRIKYKNCLFNQNSKNLHQLEAVTTNIEALYIDGFREEPQYQKDGISIISTQDKIVSITLGEISNVFRLNGQQSLPRLIQRYHTFKRPKKEGVWNDMVLHFDNPYEIREINNTISIPLSDLDHFTIDDYCKTQLSWGVITEAVLTCPANRFAITTQHK